MKYRFNGSHSELGNGIVLSRPGQEVELDPEDAQIYIERGVPIEPVVAQPAHAPAEEIPEKGE